MGELARARDSKAGGAWVSSRALATGSGASLLRLHTEQTGRWACRAIDLVTEDELRIRFETEGGDWLEIVVLPAGIEGPVFRRFERCAVRYRGSLRGIEPDGRAEVLALVLAVVSVVEATLGAAPPGATIAEAFGRRGRGRVVFGRDALLELLAPEIAVGVPLAGGWILRDVYPTSYFRNEPSERLELVLEFEREGTPQRVLIEVRRRDDAGGAFARSVHFDLAELTLGREQVPGVDGLRSLLSFVVQLRDHAGLDVHFPTSVGEAPLRSLPAAPDARAADTALNLAISSDCGQHCSFCSARDVVPPADGGEAVLARVVADLRDSRARGIRWVRVNGYDPLSYSRILEVLEEILRLGYERLELYSPCTRLAEPRFAEEIVRRLPSRSSVRVPLYGTTAEVHDQVVGTRGAFDEVQRALAQLERLLPGGVKLMTVVTRENVGELEALGRFAAERGLLISFHLPFPSFEGRSDRFRTSSPRHEEVAAAVARAKQHGVSIVVEGLAPCVLFRAMRTAGVAPTEWVPALAEHPLVPGTAYRDALHVHRASKAGHAAFAVPTVPCGAASGCALRSVCAEELLRSYADVYGLDEFVRVSLVELLAAAP